MRAKQIKVSKDWLNQPASSRSHAVPKTVRLAVEDVLKLSDLPDLIDQEEAAKQIRLSKYSCGELMRSGALMNVKIGRHRFTTPQWIALFLQGQLNKNA